VLNATCVPQSGTVPVGLSTTNITPNSALLNWTPVAGATTYTVQFKLSSAGAWTTAGNSTSASYSLTGLTANSAYQWQVKTDCSNYSATAQFTTTTGGGGGGSCAAPNSLTAVSITASGATLVWNQSSGASNYTVRYKLSTSSAWLTAGSTSGLTFNLSNLSAASKYDWQVKANCSNWSATSFFTTATGGGGGGTCNAPTNLTNSNVGPSYATISWSAVQGATNYSLQIKLANSSNWFSLGSVTVTTVVVSGLQANTNYHWRVKANCSDYSAIKLLTTAQNLGGGGTDGFGQPFIAEELRDANTLRVFPNPASDLVNLRWGQSEPSAETRLQLADLAGRSVAELAFAETIDISALAPGVYLLTLLEGQRRLGTARLVKAVQ
jgi:Fibronectin type III domain.